MHPPQNKIGSNNASTGLSTGSDASLTPPVMAARSGDSLADIAARTGIDLETLRAANPHLPNPDWLLQGQEVNLPLHSEPDFAPAAGVAGAVGRDALVHRLMDRAYEAGKQTPQGDFRGEVFRGLATKHEAGVLNHTFGSPGRYNDASSRLLYFAPTETGSVNEASVYNGMKNRSIVQLELSVTSLEQGTGGLADVREGLRQQSLPERAVTIPKGGNAPGLWHIITGEHPYGLSQQVGKGVQDAGASAMRAPAAVGGDQINVIPRNATPDQFAPLAARAYDADGNPGIQRQGPVVDPMPANDRPVINGRLEKAAGKLASAHESPKVPDTLAEEIKFRLTGADHGYPRASGARYGAAGGAAATLIDAGVSLASGQSVEAVKLATDVAANAALGAGAARATDLLTPKLGTIKAGGIAGGAIESVVSTVQNAKDFGDGKINGSTATANVVVDTSVAIASGSAGAAVGAAVGSVVPLGGTAVGAVTGFAVGVGVHYAIQAVGQMTGALDAAKSNLAERLSSFESPLSHSWETLSTQIDSAKASLATAINNTDPRS